MDIIQERLNREYDLGVIATTPSVEYKVIKKHGEPEMISNPTEFPDRGEIERIEEPFVKATILLPNDYIGNIMDLCQHKRGTYIDLEYIDDKRSRVVYEMPLSEIVFDFFDKMKSLSKGYASFEYDFIGYKTSELVKVDILLNGDKIDAFSFITHRDSAYEKSRDLTRRLKDSIPRQNFEVPVQATIGGKIIARETIKAYRKDVTHKLHAADLSRSKKLLEKQKAGKKKMKMLGTVEVPQEAFLKILKTNVDEKK